MTARRAALATTSFLIALYAASPFLVEHLLPPFLGRWGIEGAHIVVGYPTWRGVDVERFALATVGVEIDGGATRVDWSLPQLFRGELESVVVSELTVRILRGGGEAAAPVELPPFWALVPAQRVRVDRLAVTNDEPRVDGTGRVTFDPDVLQANLRVESPLLAVPLDVAASVDPSGRLAVTVNEGNGAEALVSLSGAIDRVARTLAFDGRGALRGRPLELLAAYADVRSIDGSLQWQITGRTPWPLPADGPATGVDADIRYQVDVAGIAGAFGTASAKFDGDAVIANGAVKGRIEAGGSANLDSAALADIAPRIGVGSPVVIEADQDVGIEFADRRLRVGDGLTLSLTTPERPIRLHVRGAVGVDRSFDVSVVGLDGAPVLLATGVPDAGATALKGQVALTGKPLHALVAAAGIVETGGHVSVDFEGRLGAGTKSAFGVDGRGRARFALTGKRGDDVFDAAFEADYAVGATIDAKVDAGAHLILTSAGIEASTVGPIAIAIKTAPLGIDVGAIDCRVSLPPIAVGERAVTLANAWISADGVKLAGNVLTTSATLRTHAGRDAWPIRVTIAHDLDTATGTFGLGGSWRAQKAALKAELPGFDAPYDVDDGTIELRLDGGWNVAKATYAAHGRLQVNANRAHYDAYAVQGVTADLPLAISSDGFSIASNIVTIDSVDIGFPVTNVAVDFDVDAGVAHVNDLSGAVLGGRFGARVFEYDLALDKTTLTLDLSDLSLAQVLALEGGDVRGDGLLDGRLPVTLDGSTVLVTDGRVTARAPGGTLIYKGSAAASLADRSGLAFALQALEDFRYDTLDAKVALAADGVLALGVRLQGVNPAVEQGRAIQFNLNVTESLPALLQSLRAADRITEQVERRLVQ